MVEYLLEWLHKENFPIPLEADSDRKRVNSERLTCWKRFNYYVDRNGPFFTLKLFKHSTQSLFSPTKGDVDGVTKYQETCEILRSNSRGTKRSSHKH